MHPLLNSVEKKVKLDFRCVNDSFGSVVKHLGYSVIISVVQKADIGHKAVVQNVIQVFLIFIFFFACYWGTKL